MYSRALTLFLIAGSFGRNIKSRENDKRGKTLKYKELTQKFRVRYKAAAEKYLKRSLDELMHCKPGQAYSVLKRMGARPGDCKDA